MAGPTDLPMPDPEPLGPGEERRLLADYRAGDRSAGEALVAHTYRKIFGALVRLAGGDPELAADLTQETYRRAWQALPRFRGGSRLATWLYRIAYTTFLNHVRRPRRLVPLEELPGLEAVDGDADPGDRAGASEAALRLRRAVLELDDDLRFAVTARYWGELSVRQIARHEGVTPGAVRKRLQRAIRSLGETLGEETP